MKKIIIVLFVVSLFLINGCEIEDLVDDCCNYVNQSCVNNNDCDMLMNCDGNEGAKGNCIDNKCQCPEIICPEECPDYAPPAEGWCDDGITIGSEPDKCGCRSPPRCIRYNKYCEDKEDCEIVANSCCSCGLVQQVDVISKNFKEKWVEDLNCDENLACLQGCSVPENYEKDFDCIKGKCKLFTNPINEERLDSRYFSEIDYCENHFDCVKIDNCCNGCYKDYVNVFHMNMDECLTEVCVQDCPGPDSFPIARCIDNKCGPREN